jgi:beta-phosphoglucomutase
MLSGNIAAIFDMDGVIVDNDVYHFRAWGELCKNYGIQVSDEEVRSWFGNTNPMIIRNLFGENVDQKFIDKMGSEKETLYRDTYLPDIKPVKGLEAFLSDLFDSGIMIAMATSAPTENVDFVLRNTGFGRYFTHIIDSSMIKEGKPSPEIYNKTAGVLGLKPTECLVFEDSFHGIESALRAGMKVVGVATTHTKEKLRGTELNISDFTEINAIEVIRILKRI